MYKKYQNFSKECKNQNIRLVEKPKYSNFF